MVKSQLVPLALSALLLASPCVLAEEAGAGAPAAPPAAAEPVPPPPPAPTAAVPAPAMPVEQAPVLGGTEQTRPAGGGIGQPGAMQPGAVLGAMPKLEGMHKCAGMGQGKMGATQVGAGQGAMAKGDAMDKCGGMIKGEAAEKCRGMHGMGTRMGTQMPGAEAGMMPEACRHKCRTMHMMGGMQDDEGGHCGMGMMHGGHEMMARQQALMKRLDILDARLARIELMLEHLMQR